MNKYRGTQFLSITLITVALLTACNKPPGNFEGLQRTSSNAVNVADADVTENVKRALQGDPELNGLVIIVTTRKGDVRLVGVVDTQRQIDTAIKLAQRADGFHTIHNELIIRK
ncbi:BON domain-containing protein [Oceanisphaera pacifica]|uniref:BON domain-containing protein n=1 Tax=Oceanisphaera pacifica TaxID=2818389 RepID=A0ABS3NJG8_9GAMM|nr:BON domain-containing protein [Oceanisphaera pacifica]MBO1520457.1 BON domain-containing protein [Oceanisphaera pacifica]